MKRIAACATLIALLGCAQTNVQVERETFASVPRPNVVLVQKLATNLSDVTANQSIVQQGIDAATNETQTGRDRALARDVADRFSDVLVEKINGYGLYARRASAYEQVPPSAVMVTGYFQDIDAGNRLRRLVIGFGAGQSQIDAQVQLLAQGSRTLLAFETHADSGEMPGAAVTMGAGAAAQGGVTAGMAVANAGLSGVKGYRSAMDPMASRAAGKAAVTLGNFFVSQGWLPASAIPSTPF